MSFTCRDLLVFTKDLKTDTTEDHFTNIMSSLGKSIIKPNLLIVFSKLAVVSGSLEDTSDDITASNQVMCPGADIFNIRDHY